MKKDKRRYINTSIWNKTWFRKLSHEAQHLYLYLLTSTLSTISGVYEVSDELIGFYTKLEPARAMQELVEAGEVERIGDWVIIIKHPAFQKWATNTKIAIGLMSELEEIPEKVFHSLRRAGYMYPPVYSASEWQDEVIRLQGKGMNQGEGFITEPPYPLPPIREEAT